MTTLNIINDVCARNVEERRSVIEQAQTRLKVAQVSKRIFTSKELDALDETSRSQAWDNLSWIREFPSAQFPLSSTVDNKYYAFVCPDDKFHKRLVNILIACGVKAVRLRETEADLKSSMTHKTKYNGEVFVVLCQGTMEAGTWEDDVRIVNALEIFYSDNYSEIFQKVRVALDLNDYALSVINKVNEVAPERFTASYTARRSGLAFDNEINVEFFDTVNGNHAEIVMRVDTDGISSVQFRGIKEGLPTTQCSYSIKFMAFQNIADWFVAWYKSEKIDEDITAQRLVALEELVHDFNELVLATPLIHLPKVVLTVEHNFSNKVDVRANYTGVGVGNNSDCELDDCVVREFAHIEYGEDSRYDCLLKILLAYYSAAVHDGLSVVYDTATTWFINSRGTECLLGEIVLDMISRTHKIPIAAIDFQFSQAYMDKVYLYKNREVINNHDITRDDFTKVFKDANGVFTEEVRSNYQSLVDKFVKALLN